MPSTPRVTRRELSEVRRSPALYDGGRFHRTVRPDNQRDKPVKIAVIQAAASTARRADFLPPIALERTNATGLRHKDGMVSMARAGIDTATHEFFICIGDQPELDFGGTRNPDGQGFAAFGRVVRGMDVVRRIHGAPATGETLTPSDHHHSRAPSRRTNLIELRHPCYSG